ncbi:MAG: AmmeMemoRadiSam system protein A [Actinobacteria bacterium]|nr:AmmeMemoRadiSam system protein A [Actinomycetota bacterium]
MPVVFCGVCPHPPIMVPEVGKEQSDIVIKSRKAMLELGRRLKESGARSLVIISPHGPVFRDGIALNTGKALKGSLKGFGAPRVSFDLENDLQLASAIDRRARDAGIITLMMDESAAGQYQVSLDLDHGLIVPLYFIREAGVDLPVAVVYMGLLPPDQLYRFGMAIGEAVEESGKKVAVIASGDLSHCLTADAPAGYNPRGREFDREMVRLLGGADVMGIINMESDLVEKAGECGLRPITMMLGALDGRKVNAEVLSYEGPFGVGYLVAALTPGDGEAGREFGRTIGESRRSMDESRKKREGFLPRVAREALENYARGKKYNVSPADVPGEFSKPAGVFVSLKKDGQLRGCIGTILPRYGSIVEETVNNAISAGHRDPRFYPLDPGEIDGLDISVDVLYPPEPVQGLAELDPLRYGVIVKSGRKQGLLLPNLEGIDTVEEQVEIARQKAGIAAGDPVELERFEVIRHK